jgi:hypothetical protein
MSLPSANRPDVLALVFAVAYWDWLGWKDTFSNPEWTARLYAYVRAIGGDGVYTPQVIVNGRVEGTGLDANELASLMRSADRGDSGPSVGFAGGAVTVGAAAAPGGGGDVWVARYDPRVVEVAVKRGENAGKTLPHKNVVPPETPVSPPAAKGFPLALRLQGVGRANAHRWTPVCAPNDDDAAVGPYLVRSRIVLSEA